MCLLLLALNCVPGRPWLLLGNRDEFHTRPTAPAQAWVDTSDIVGGRDLQAGGSWLAVNRNGRYAAVTNVRNGAARPAPRSRGELVGNFVAGRDSAADYVADIATRRAEYGPFNLIVGDGSCAWLVSSIDGGVRHLGSGIHAFSNGLPESEWPKMHRLRTRFAAMLQRGTSDDRHDQEEPPLDFRDQERMQKPLLDLLIDTEQPQDADLPDTGVGLELERRLGPIFIRGETYGTRASTLAYARADGSLVLHERRFGPNAAPLGDSVIEVSPVP